MKASFIRDSNCLHIHTFCRCDMAEPDGLAQAGHSAIVSEKVRPSTCCEAAVFS